MSNIVYNSPASYPPTQDETAENPGRLKVSFVEPIGGHRGNDFYDFGLCRALSDQQVDITFYTCNETDLDQRFSFAFETQKFFNRIYGSDFILIRGLRYLIASLRTIAHAQGKHAEIVHLHIYHFAWREFFLLWLFHRRGFKVVATIHDVEDFRKFGTEINRSKYRKFERRIHRIIVHSDFAGQSVEKYFNQFTREKIHRVPHGDTDFLFRADCSPAEARQKLNLPADVPLILFFGQIKKVKGLDILLRAFALLKKENVNAKLLIAGPVWKIDAQEFTYIIEKNKLEEDCILRFEYIESDIVPFYFKACDLVVLPYRKIYSSGVLIRSLDYGAAIVLSDLDVFKDVIQNNVDGVFFKSEDANDLCTQMKNLLNNISLQETLRINAKKTADQKFSWKLIAEKVKEVYTLALND